MRISLSALETMVAWERREGTPQHLTVASAGKVGKVCPDLRSEATAPLKRSLGPLQAPVYLVYNGRRPRQVRRQGWRLRQGPQGPARECLSSAIRDASPEVEMQSASRAGPTMGPQQ
jgi:hypothetical protein